MNKSTATRAEKVEPTGQTVEIEITYDRSKPAPERIVQVKPATFMVSKWNCEQVHWYSRNKDASLPAPAFTVDFGKNGSPFYEIQFDHEHPFSGHVRRSVLPDERKIYEYTVRIEDTSLDPGGGVKA